LNGIQVWYEPHPVVSRLFDGSAVDQESVAGLSTAIDGEISGSALPRDGPIPQLSIRRLIDHTRLQPQQINITAAIQRE